ncbi:MAG: CRISPR-associated protein Cas4, partial [Acidobacteriaceae bacterium]|nr:CRISPR-associated protein Cas4 [Acidobacteriaceae bacterium]
MYSEDDLLPLSGLQHLAFCERQWALIQIEGIWEENGLTADGRVLHHRVHEQAEEKRHDLLVVRSLPVHSLRLGLSGVADVVQFVRISESPVPGAVQLESRPGWWLVQPVEYKRGRAKRESCDRIQLCAQALCLEEMFRTNIPEGFLFYGEVRRRTLVRFDPELRHETGLLA